DRDVRVVVFELGGEPLEDALRLVALAGPPRDGDVGVGVELGRAAARAAGERCGGRRGRGGEGDPCDASLHVLCPLVRVTQSWLLNERFQSQNDDSLT